MLFSCVIFCFGFCFISSLVFSNWFVIFIRLTLSITVCFVFFFQSSRFSVRFINSQVVCICNDNQIILVWIGRVQVALSVGILISFFFSRHSVRNEDSMTNISNCPKIYRLFFSSNKYQTSWFLFYLESLK